MTTVTCDGIFKAIVPGEWAAIPEEPDAMLEVDWVAPADLLESQARERESALQADLATVREYVDLDALDDYIEQLIDTLAIELLLLGAPELAAITEETGGRAIARMRRAMAADLLKMRLA